MSVRMFLSPLIVYAADPLPRTATGSTPHRNGFALQGGIDRTDDSTAALFHHCDGVARGVDFDHFETLPYCNGSGKSDGDVAAGGVNNHHFVSRREGIIGAFGVRMIDDSAAKCYFVVGRIDQQGISARAAIGVE